MISHISYVRKKQNLERILSQLGYAGNIPTRKTIKDEFRAIKELIELVYKKNKLVKKIKFLNKEIDVTVNFDESHLKIILNFLQNKEYVINKLNKIELSHKLEKIIELSNIEQLKIKEYKNEINKIKYDYNDIKDIHKARSFLKDLEKKIESSFLKDLEKKIEASFDKNLPEEIQFYNEPDFLYSYQKNVDTQTIKICKFLLNSKNRVTQSQIKENVKFKDAVINRILHELFGKSLIIGTRGVKEKDFIIYWEPTIELEKYNDELEALIKEDLKNEAEKLKIFQEFNDSGINKF